MQEGARVLESLGARVPSIEYPDLAHYADNGAFLADAAAYHEETLKERLRITRRSSEPACVTPSTCAPSITARPLQATGAQTRYEAPVRAGRPILTPTSLIVAPRFPDESPMPLQNLLVRNTGSFNASGGPVISVRGLSREGMPIGMSLAGRDWEEALVLRAPHAYQQATDWHTRLPRYCLSRAASLETRPVQFRVFVGTVMQAQ